MGLEERVAIVTGGGKGIGKHYCKGLAAEGAAVVVAEIDAGAAETTAAELRAAGHRAMEVPTDVSDEASVKAMVARTRETFGRLLFVNHLPSWQPPSRSRSAACWACPSRPCQRRR